MPPKSRNQKKNNKQSTTINIVTPKNAPKTKKNRPKRSLAPSGGYGAFLMDPTNPKFDGMRQPSDYSFPTVPYKIRLVTTAGTATQGAIILLPHPLISVIDALQLAGGSTSISSTAMAPFSANPTVFGACTATNLGTVYSRYRMVGKSSVVKILTPPLYRTGKIFVVPLPCVPNVPGINALTNIPMLNTSYAARSLCLGIAPNNVNSAILNLPGAREINVAELRKGEFELYYRPVSGAFETFHTTNTGYSYSATQFYGDHFTGVSATMALTAEDSGDAVDMSGWNGWAIYYEGFTNGQPSFEIEDHFFMEGTPSVSQSTTGGAAGMAPVPAYTPPARPDGNISQILSKVSKMPWVQIADSAYSGAQAIGHLANMLRGGGGGNLAIMNGDL